MASAHANPELSVVANNYNNSMYQWKYVLPPTPLNQYVPRHAMQCEIPDELRENTDPAVSLDTEYTQKVVEALHLNAENHLYHQLDTLKTTALRNYAVDIPKAKKVMKKRCQITDEKVAFGMVVNPTTYDNIKLQCGDVEVIDALGLEQLHIGRALVQSKSGKITYLWSKKAALILLPFGCGRTRQTPLEVTKHRNESESHDLIKAAYQYQFEFTNLNAIYMFSTKAFDSGRYLVGGIQRPLAPPIWERHQINESNGSS